MLQEFFQGIGVEVDAAPPVRWGKVLGTEDVGVDQIGHQGVNHGGAKFLHQIADQGRAMGLGHMQVAEVGVQPCRFHHGVNVLRQQGIAQTQQAVDRIGGRAAGAFFKGKLALEQTGECLEVEMGRLPFVAQHGFH